MRSFNNSQNTLFITSLLLIITFIVEFLGGILFGSLSLLSDSFHVLADLSSILIAFFALSIAVKKKPSNKMAFGFHRIEVMSALFNGIILSIISVFILFEALSRFKKPGLIDTNSTLVIALIGFIVNVIVIRLFHKNIDKKKDVNIKSAYLHIMGDLFSSASVIIGIVSIKLFNVSIIDPIIAILIAILLIIGAIRVLYKSTEILLQKSPQDIEKLKKRILKINEVIDFLDIRLWQVCSHLTVGTAHVVVSNDSIKSTRKIKENIKLIFNEEFNIRDITLEFETPEEANNHSHLFQYNH